MKTQEELKRIAEQQGYYGSTQFPIIFSDGEVLFQDPEKMRKPYGYPMIEPERYVKKYRPERLEEIQEWRKARIESLERLDEEVKKVREKY